MLHEILNMSWPFATFLIASVIGSVVVYGINKADADMKRGD